jgi:hypothetical protein
MPGSSFLLGFFAIGPFLALRRYQVTPAPPSWAMVRLVIENKVIAVLALAGGAYLAFFALTAGDFPSFGECSEDKSGLDLYLKRSSRGLERAIT